MNQTEEIVEKCGNMSRDFDIAAVFAFVQLSISLLPVLIIGCLKIYLIGQRNPFSYKEYMQRMFWKFPAGTITSSIYLGNILQSY